MQADIGATICMAGYAAKVRPPVSYTDPLKRRQIAEYGYTDAMVADYEEDHLIPIELEGAPTDPRNLWPEPHYPHPGSVDKDRLEDRLHALVCSGQVPLAMAQTAIATDWTAAYTRWVSP